VVAVCTLTITQSDNFGQEIQRCADVPAGN